MNLAVTVGLAGLEEIKDYKDHLPMRYVGN